MMIKTIIINIKDVILMNISNLTIMLIGIDKKVTKPKIANKCIYLSKENIKPPNPYHDVVMRV